MAILEIKIKGAQRLYKKLFKLASKYTGGETLMRMIGEAMITGIKNYYEYLDLMHSRYAHGFYPKEAKKFRIVMGRSKDSVSIRSTSANIIHKLTGGDIEPANAEMLAIPISKQAKAYKGSFRYARNALNGRKSFIFRSKSGNLILTERSFSIMYVLKESVYHSPKRYVDPMNTAIGKEFMYESVNGRLEQYTREMQRIFDR